MERRTRPRSARVEGLQNRQLRFGRRQFRPHAYSSTATQTGDGWNRPYCELWTEERAPYLLERIARCKRRDRFLIAKDKIAKLKADDVTDEMVAALEATLAKMKAGSDA